MKLLLLLTFFISTNTFASGCFPDDVYLDKEEVKYSWGKTYIGYLKCHSKQECVLSVWNDDITDRGYDTEAYKLYLIGQRIGTSEIFDVEIKRIKQYFVSSCTELEREVIGADISGMRFRSKKDLDYL